ncbi:MAG TPA: CRTAC1 family protein [Pseudonocardiaceae bacterium]|nr:CRTAC1 family protein [Pseudonocardiaceae bacterium]
MPSFRERARKLIPGLAAVAVLVTIFFVGQAQVSVAGAAQIAGAYKFKEMPIALPPGYNNQHFNTVRQVNPAYLHLDAWISSVGASIAINDLTGHGRSDSMCIVDTRTNDVIVTYTPTAVAADRFTPFVLDAAPLPIDDTMAPTACTPGDFNGDGRMDLLVTYWGRTPVLFMAKASATTLSPTSYQPQELVPEQSVDGKYHGSRWNTDADYVADLDGSGHPDIIIGNYFPDSDVLDPHGLNNVQMNQSLSNAGNGGGDHVLRWYAGTSGDHPSASYVMEPDAIPFDASTGWTLALSGADLTGNGLPDVYIGNDFGHGHLLYNRSTPGNIRFTEAKGIREPDTPKSFQLGNGSFKGMGVDFADLNDNGRFDFMVSNITTAWGLQESNLLFINNARSDAEMTSDLKQNIAPFTQESEQYGVAWTGWSWDVKMADFLNNGSQNIIQADGFVKGTIDRWPWLQEMAMTNDDLLTNPAMWPNIKPGDDVAGSQVLAFYAKGTDGKYANITGNVGLNVPTPTRGIATADTTGDGAMDFAVARQWGPPAFYANEAPRRGSFLDLNLFRPATDGTAGAGLSNTGTPAYDATVRITTPKGTQIGQLDGGGGHGGFRSFQVHFGLGSYSGPVGVHVQWRDTHGQLHQQTTQLNPGTHTLVLSSDVQEASSR